MARNRMAKDTSVLSKDLILLRQIDTDALDYITGEIPEEESSLELIGKTNLNPDMKERDTPWFAAGYVANDHPRDSMLTDEIVNNTLGFAVARTDNGQILATFGPDGLMKAEKAMKGAKMALTFNVELEAEADDMPADFAIPAGAIEDQEVLG